MNEVSAEMMRDKLLALLGIQLPDAEVVKLLADLISCGGGVTLELDDVRVKLIRREGRFGMKKEERRSSSTVPPRTQPR